jgi:amino acid permease
LVGAFLLAVATGIAGVTMVGTDIVFVAQSLSVGFALIFAAILFYGMMVFHPFQSAERRRYVTLAKEEIK